MDVYTMSRDLQFNCKTKCENNFFFEKWIPQKGSVYRPTYTRNIVFLFMSSVTQLSFHLGTGSFETPCTLHIEVINLLKIQLKVWSCQILEHLI